MATGPSDVDAFQYCLRFLRRNYPASDPASAAALRDLAASTFASATERTTLIATSFQGGYAGAKENFDTKILGQAIEVVIAERGDDYVPKQDGIVIQFGP